MSFKSHTFSNMVRHSYVASKMAVPGPSRSAKTPCAGTFRSSKEAILVLTLATSMNLREIEIDGCGVDCRYGKALVFR